MLLSEPIEHIVSDDIVGDHVAKCAGTGRMKRWWVMSGEERWVVQMWGEECVERYGGLKVWVESHVPVELVRVVRGDDGEDGDGETSYGSEIA